MTLSQSIWFSKLHILQNIIQAIILLSFVGLGCLDQILQGGGGENTSPEAYTLSKSPVLIGLVQKAQKEKFDNFVHILPFT